MAGRRPAGSSMDSAHEEDMGTLTIRGLDDKVVENLKARARTRRRSLEAELREIC